MMRSDLLPLPGVANIIFLRRHEVAALCEAQAVLTSCDVLRDESKGLSVARAFVALSYNGGVVLRRFHRLERTADGDAVVYLEEGKEVNSLSSILAQDLSDQEWHKAAADMTRRMMQKQTGPITLPELRDICRSLVLLHHCAFVLAADAERHGAIGGDSRGSYRYRHGYIKGSGAAGPGIAAGASFYCPRAVAERCRDELLAALRTPPNPDDAKWASWCVTLRRFLWSPAAATQVAEHGRLANGPVSGQQQEERQERAEQQDGRQQQGQQQEGRDAGSAVDAVCRVVEGLPLRTAQPARPQEQQRDPACALPSRQPEHLHSPGQPSPTQDPRQQHVSRDAGRLGDEPRPPRHAGKRHGGVQGAPEPQPASPGHGPVTQQPVRVLEQEPETRPGLGPGPGQGPNCGHDGPSEDSLKPACGPVPGHVGPGPVPGPGHAPGPEPTSPGVDPGKGTGLAQVTALGGRGDDCQAAGGSSRRTELEAHPHPQAQPGPEGGRGSHPRVRSPSRFGPELGVSQCPRPRSKSRSRSPPLPRSKSPPIAVRDGWAGPGGSGGPGPREGPGRRSGATPEKQEGPAGRAPRGGRPEASGKAPGGSQPSSAQEWSWRVYEFLLKQPGGRADTRTLMGAGLGIPPAEFRRTGAKPATYLCQFSHLWTLAGRGESRNLCLIARPPEDVERPPGPTQQCRARRPLEEGAHLDGSGEWGRGKRQRRLGPEAPGRFNGEGGLPGPAEGAARPDRVGGPGSVPGRTGETDPRRGSRQPRPQQQQRQQQVQEHRAHMAPLAEDLPRWRRGSEPSDAATQQGQQQQRQQQQQGQQQQEQRQQQQQQQEQRQRRQQQTLQPPPVGREVGGRPDMPPGLRVPAEWQQQQRRDAWEPGRNGARDLERVREERVAARWTDQQACDNRGLGLSGGEALPRGRVGASHFESEEERDIVERICGVLRQHPQGVTLAELRSRGYQVPAGVLRNRGPAAWAKRHACIWNISFGSPLALTLLPDQDVIRGGAGA